MNSKELRINNMRSTITLLKRRGFLVDSVDEVNYFSDNSHPADAAFLDNILQKYHIGHMDGSRLCIPHPENGIALVHLFDPAKSIGTEMSWWNVCKWREFAHFEHGLKVPVEVLEPNISFYCKAISACGLDTASSCDGNHGEANSELFVLFNTAAYTFWHSLLWELVLKEQFSLNWENNCTRVKLNKANRNVVYEILFRVADYLYNNRILFRNLKSDAAAILTKKFCRDNNDSAIKLALTIKASELLISDTYNKLL